MGGAHCAIVGCFTCNSRSKGVSFFRIPKSGVNAETDEWRRQLLHAVNRIDHGFNPNTASVCSIHFTDDCFLKHGTYQYLNERLYVYIY